MDARGYVERHVERIARIGWRHYPRTGLSIEQGFVPFRWRPRRCPVYFHLWKQRLLGIARKILFFFFSTSRNFPFLLCAKSLTTNMYDWKIVSKKILSNLDRQVPSSLLFPTFVLTVYVRVKTYVRIVHRSRLCQVDSVCKTCENSERRSDIYRYAQCVTRAFKRILSLLYDVAFTYPAVVARFWLEHYPSISFSLSFSLSPSFSIYLRSCGTKGRAQQFEMNCPQLNNKPIRACIQRAYMYVRNTLETE